MASKKLHGKNPIQWSAPIAGTAFENFQVTSVRQAIQSLHTKGQYLEVKHNMDIPEFEYINLNNHFQGIQRLRKNNYVVLSGASKRSKHAHLFIAKIAPITQHKDKPLGTNVLFKHIPHDDRLKAIICSDKGDLWHAGGISVSGDVLVIPLEGKTDTSLGRRDSSKIIFYNMVDPENPVVYPVSINRRFQKAGAVSMVRLANEKFMCAVWSDSDDLLKRFDFYLSKTKNLTDGFLKIKTIPVRQVVNYSGREPKFQGIDFVQQKDSQLFIVGFYNTRKTAPVISGTNKSIVYQVNYTTKSNNLSIQLEQLLIKDFEDGNKQYNMGGATGVYVTKQGDLSLYAAHHWKTKRTIKCAEFRAKLDPLNRIISSIKSACCELYEHVLFHGRCLILYADAVTEIPSFKKIYVQGKSFNDKVSSLRFQLPKTHNLILFEHEFYKGKKTILEGTGHVIQISNLGSQNDKFSSLKLIKKK